MKILDIQKNIFIILVGSFSCFAFAVDKISDAYKMGGLVGKIFIVILALLIFKKIFFKKK